MLPERRRGSYQKSEGLFMSPDSLQTLIAMICYMAVVIFIGLYFAKRAIKAVKTISSAEEVWARG